MQPGEDEIDYRETADVTRVHGAVKREHKEPEVGIVPVPVWWFAVVILVAFGGAFYLGQYGGGFRGDVFNENEGNVAAAAKGGAAGAAAGGEAKVVSLAEQGKKVFNQNCASCHQTNGAGVPGTYPALAGAHWVNDSPKRLTALVLKGMQGPHVADGKSYNGAMPAWASLKEQKVAAVLSYIRSAWGNTAGEITPEQVAAVQAEFASRTESFTSPELEAITGDIQAAPAP
jgi:mono/diheme cytochrome c family protein